MDLMKSTQSISRYKVEFVEGSDISGTILEALKKYVIPSDDLRELTAEAVAGWVPLESPYDPDFDKYPFQYGDKIIFSLRIDKKSIPADLVKQRVAAAIQKKMKETGREFLSKNEKSEIKELVIDDLVIQTPFVPKVYDIVWDYASATVSLYTAGKAQNEFFTTLFFKTFERKLIPLFPYTMISEDFEFPQDVLTKVSRLSPVRFCV